MARDFEVHGADQLAALSRRMKEAGAGDLRKEMQKALRQAVKPLTPASRAEARRRLPNRGGLADRVAKAPQRQTARSGATTTSVRVTVAGKKSGAAGADAGVIRHPIFGRRQFVNQRVRPGWFSDTADRERQQMSAAVVTVLEDYAERLTRPL